MPSRILTRLNDPRTAPVSWFGGVRPGVVALVLACLDGHAWSQPQKVAVPEPPAKAAQPAPTQEDNLFQAAMKALEAGGELVSHAEAEFAAFIQKFPQSPRVPEAALRQAQCRFRQGNLKGSLDLLQTRYTKAGKLTDEYLYWMSESLLRLGDLKGAETGFAQLLKDHPQSGRLLEASYGRADALLKQKRHSEVIALLGDPNGVFRKQSAKRPKDEVVVLGLLALGEALLSSGRSEEYNTSLSAELFERIESDAGASNELRWRWHSLEYRNHMAGKQFEKAVGSAENLIHLGGKIVDAEWRAESIVRKAEALLALERIDDAVETYRLALGQGVPRVRQREALNQIVSLRAAQNKNVEGIAYLRMIETNYPTAPDLDLVYLTVGELSLEEFVVNQGGSTNPPPALLSSTTNFLGLAKSQFDFVIGKFTNSVHLGAALLHRGECFEIVGDSTNALANFTLAAARAGVRTNAALRARALYKAGDAEFKLNRYLAAANHYRAALEEGAKAPEVRAEFGDRAVFQMASAAVLLDDLGMARGALERLRKEYPKSPRYGRAALLVGQALNDAGQHDQALKVFSDCQLSIEKAGVKSPLTSELMLAGAATYGAKGDWPHAIAAISGWLSAEGDSGHPLAVRAEFELGRLNSLSGNISNAFGIYTNFVERRKTNQLAAHAHLWLGDYFFNQGVDSLHLAEKHYQLVFQNTNWPASELTWQAQIQAGRCAMLRQGRNEARTFYFSKLAENKEAPAEWRAKAIFAIGDSHTEEGGPDRWSKAINVFNEIADNYTNSSLYPLALGRIADCNMQNGALAVGTDPKAAVAYYDASIEYYRRAAAAPQARISTRSAAEFALGLVYQAKARLKEPADPELLKEARKLWSKVFRGEGVRVEEGERPDAYWVEKAARELARSLLEDGDAATSVSVLESLKAQFPHLSAKLDARIKAVVER